MSHMLYISQGSKSHFLSQFPIALLDRLLLHAMCTLFPIPECITPSSLHSVGMWPHATHTKVGDLPLSIFPGVLKKYSHYHRSLLINSQTPGGNSN